MLVFTGVTILMRSLSLFFTHTLSLALTHTHIINLFIQEPSMADAGLYRCNAFNAFGDRNANIDLNFESKKKRYTRAKGPEILKDPKRDLDYVGLNSRGPLLRLC